MRRSAEDPMKSEAARYTGAMRGPALRSPPLPFRILVGLLLVGAACGVLFVALPTEHPQLKAMDAAASALYSIMALAVWFVMPRIPNQWGLDIAIWFTSLTTFAAVSFIDLPDGRVLTGFEVVLFAVFAAYFLPLHRFVATFLVMAIGYGVAVLAIGDSIPAVYYVIIIFITASVSGFVAVLVARLREQATTDALTGALNRHGLELTTQYLQRDQVTSVAMVDLNGFKRYNDRYGHLAGDERLIDVATRLRSALGRTDLTARFGGDEFIVVLPRRTVEQAEEILARTAGDPADFSIGVTKWAQDEDLTHALQRADQRLYAAKAQR